MHSISSALTFTLLLLAGCSIKLEGDGGSTSTSEATDSDATLGHSSAPITTGEPPTLSASTTMGAPTSTGSGATEPDGTGTGSSGGGSSSGGALPTTCERVCELALMCDPNKDEATCVVLCESDLAEATPACAAATETMLQCFTGLTCEQLALALDGDPGNPCGPEQIDRGDACGGGQQTCDTGGGGNINGLACMLETQCLGAPLRRMECDAEQCECFEDDVLIGSCAADDGCVDLSQLGAKALSCCGFPDNGPEVP